MLAALQNARPDTAIVLGSGLGAVAEAFGIECEVPYDQVPGLSASTVPGHAGRFVLGKQNGKPIMLAQGRRHLYEGLSAHEVTASIRFMHEIGVRRVVLTNAAGAIHDSFHVGGLMLITDHLNLQGTTPLLGGPHFHDMSEVYSLALRERLLAAAREQHLTLHQGVYSALLGPQYETPAEIRMLRALGADAVGMSTVPEAIAARHCGLQTIGISLITNMAAGILDQTLTHEEVQEAAGAASKKFTRLVDGIVQSVF